MSENRWLRVLTCPVTRLVPEKSLEASTYHSAACSVVVPEPSGVNRPMSVMPSPSMSRATGRDVALYDRPLPVVVNDWTML